jgi:signal transduction histidine kinase
MTSIKGYVDVMLMGAAGELSEQQAQFLSIVRSNTERLNILVNDLLDISRIEAGKIDLTMQPLRILQIAEEVVSEHQQRTDGDGKDVSIEVDIPADLKNAWGDDGRVRQILANLISNAYQYTPADGHIYVTASSKDTEIQINVQDDGIGISAEEKERVFERFYRGEDPLVLASAGTGLGLAIVSQLVAMHGGRIWVESAGIPGEGSTFSFTLPIYHEG